MRPPGICLSRSANASILKMKQADSYANSSPTPPKTRRLLVLGVMVGVGAVAFAVWPRGPRLEWYTSVAFDLDGTQVRAKLLVPAGWREVPDNGDFFFLRSTSQRRRISPGCQAGCPPGSESLLERTKTNLSLYLDHLNLTETLAPLT